MDVVVPSICLSSFAGALLFYAGGRLHAHGDPIESPPPPPEHKAGSPELEAERAARGRAEEESAGAWRAHQEAVAALAEERSRTVAAREELADERRARARADAEAGSERHRFAEEASRLRAHATELAEQLATLRARVTNEGGEGARMRTQLGAVEARAVAAELRAGEVGAELVKARAELEKATGASRRLSNEATALRAKLNQQTRAASMIEATRGAAAESEAEAARLREENERLQRALAAEKERAPAPDLAEVQRRGLEVAMKLRVLEQRSEEIARREAENQDLRRQVDALRATASENEGLRSRVRDLEAQGFAQRTLASADALDEVPDSEGRLELESSLELGLRELCKREEGCRGAVLSDMRGLLIAAYGASTHRHEMAAAASLMTSAAERVRELYPLGEPVSLALVDENALVFRTRWLRWSSESFLLCTVGAAPAGRDLAVEALCTELSELIGPG